MFAKTRRYLLCALMGLLLCAAAFTAGAEETSGGLEVHFLNIGRNDGILIRCGGESAFIDSGLYERGRDAVEYMHGIGMSELTYYIGTHMHEDHVGGAPVIIDTLRPEAVILPDEAVGIMIEEYAQTNQEREVLKQTPHIVMERGQTINIGGSTITCIGPVRIRNVKYDDQNVNSLVLKLTYGEVDILLTGDATMKEFEEILALDPLCLRAEVFKNAHHGADADEKIITAVSPAYTIFSTDESSRPTLEMLERLHDAGSVVLSTSPAHCGNIILRTDGREIDFDVQNKVTSLSLDKTEIEIYEGKSVKLRASLQPSRRSKLLTYISSDPSVATVDRYGAVNGVSAGEAVIRVYEGSGVYAECTVTVKPAELKLKKTELTVKAGSKVTAGYSILPKGTKTEITWASMDESIAKVDQKGKITGIYPGETVITATTSGGSVSEVKVTVTPIEVKRVSVKPSRVTLTIGDSRSVTASVSPSNATWKDIAWSSEDESILTVTSDGVLNAVGVGKTKLTATAVNGKSKSISVTVKPVYVKKIVPEESSIELIGGMAGYERAQLSYAIEPADATIKDVTWKSSNPRVVTVNENGVITAVKEGNATITCKAADGSGKYAKIKVYVEMATERIVLNESEFDLYEGKSRTIKATIQPRSRTKKLTYTSSNEEVALVSSSGKVTGVKAGTAVIRVSDKMGVYSECVVTVRPATMFLRKSTLTLKDGKSASASYSIQPSGSKPVVEWASMDESIATVSQKGKITGQYPGETTITATMPSGQVSEIKVTVTPVKATRVTIKPSSVTMTIGDSRSVTAKVSPSNATWQEITWSSEDAGIAAITQDGLLTAVGVGETTITATTLEGKTRSATVRVKPVYVKKITLTKPNVELIGGVNGRNQVQFSYGIEPANATIQDVTWSSSNKKIATVDENGVVTGLKAGTVTITCRAADGSRRYARIKVTFKENELDRNVQAVPGEMVIQAERIRYKDSGKTLEVKMAYKNRTGEVQLVPAHGFLTLITPDGEKIILQQITGGQNTLRNGKNDSFTYKIPVSTSPKLVGLDLSRCDVVMLTAQEALAN